VKDAGDDNPVKGLGIRHLLSRDALDVNPIVKAAFTHEAPRGFQAADFNDIKPYEGSLGVRRGQLQ
jgi:hypothetical protein